MQHRGAVGGSDAQEVIDEFSLGAAIHFADSGGEPRLEFRSDGGRRVPPQQTGGKGHTPVVLHEEKPLKQHRIEIGKFLFRKETERSDAALRVRRA